MNDFEHVSLATTYEIDESFQSNSFIKLRLKVCHNGKNANGSYFSVDSFENAQETLKNALVFGNVVYNGEIDDLDFGGHDMHLEQHQMKGHEGDFKLIYDEQIIGIIPETNDYELVEEDGKIYVYCNGFVAKNYSNYAEDIIRRDKAIRLSMEVDVLSGKYEKKDKTYRIDNFIYRGVTLLGQNKRPAMVGAQATVECFSKERFFEMIDELQEELKNHQCFDDEIKKEGETPVAKDVENIIEEPVDEQSFELQGEVVNELCERLNEEKIETEWGNYSRRLFVDYDPKQSEVYFYDVTDWKLYGCSYTMAGDVATIDFSDCKRKKYVIADFVDGTAEQHFSFETVAKDIITAQEASFAQLQSDFDTYKESYSTPNAEVDELRQFKASRLSEDHAEAVNTVLAEFEDLSDNEEFVAFAKKAVEFEDMDALREKCFAIRGRAIGPAKFAAKTPVQGRAKAPIETKPTDFDPYPGADSYINK